MSADPVSSLGIDSTLQVGQLKSSHAPCKKYKFSLTPDSSVDFQPNDVCRFTLPVRNNTFLICQNSYIKLTVNNNSAQNITLNNTCASLIDRVEEFSGGNVLSSLSNYSAIYHILYDTKYDTAAKVGMSNFNGQAVFLDNDTQVSLASAIGDQIDAGTSKTYLHSLMTPVYGLLSEKAFPLAFLKSGSDARIEITFASALKAFFSTNAVADNDITISNVTFELELLELSDVAMKMVLDGMGSTPILHTTGIKDFTATIANGSTGNQTHLVNARYSSLNTLVTCYLDKDGVAAGYSTTSRVKPINSYQLRVNSLLVPSKPITDSSQMFVESMLSFHNDPYSLHSKGSIPNVHYTANVGDNTAANGHKNRFFIAQALESIHGKSHLIMAGTNTLSSPVFTDVNLSAATTQNLFVVNYAFYDMIIQIEDGVAKVRF